MIRRTDRFFPEFFGLILGVREFVRIFEYFLLPIGAQDHCGILLFEFV
jgi:hypothetical protein